MSNPLARSFQEQKSNLFESMKIHQIDRNEMLRLLKCEMEMIIKNQYSNDELVELKKHLKDLQKDYDNLKYDLEKDQRNDLRDEIREVKQDIKDKIREIKDTYNSLKDTYKQLMDMENNQDFTFMQILQPKGNQQSGAGDKITGVLFDQESSGSNIVSQLSPEQQKELDDLNNISDAQFKIVSPVESDKDSDNDL